MYNAEMEPDIEFNLDKVLKKKNLNISDATRMTGLSYPTVYNIFVNKSRQVALSTIAKLCKGLNIKPTDLFREKVK